MSEFVRGDGLVADRGLTKMTDRLAGLWGPGGYAMRIRHRVNPRYPRVVRLRYACRSYQFWAQTSIDRYQVASLGNERHFVRRFLQALRPGDVVYDVGAHMGIYSMLAAPLVGTVVAFEPHGGLARRVRLNAELNAFRNVAVVEEAMGSKSGHLWLYDNGDGSPSLNANQGDSRRIVGVQTLDAVATKSWSAPTVVKCDVEGFEAKVFEGARELLAGQGRPRLWAVEFHPGLLKRNGSSLEEAKVFLEEFGYASVWERNRGSQVHVLYERTDEVRDAGDRHE